MSDELTAAKFWAMRHVPGARWLLHRWSALRAAAGIYRAVVKFHKSDVADSPGPEAVQE